MKQIGVACHRYLHIGGILPPGAISKSNGDGWSTSFLTWVVLILPQLEGLSARCTPAILSEICRRCMAGRHRFGNNECKMRGTNAIGFVLDTSLGATARQRSRAALPGIIPMKVRHVALLIETSREYGRGLLRGIIRYQQVHGPWSVYFKPHGLGDPPPAWLRTWRGDGILARINDRQMAEAVLKTRSCGCAAAAGTRPALIVSQLR
jgi:hypothetical protein